MKKKKIVINPDDYVVFSGGCFNGVKKRPMYRGYDTGKTLLEHIESLIVERERFSEELKAINDRHESYCNNLKNQIMRLKRTLIGCIKNNDDAQRYVIDIIAQPFPESPDSK